MTLIPSGAKDLLGRIRASNARMPFASVVRRVAGMPDYPRYLAHLRAHHPECAIPTEREYYATYIKGRYEGGPNRCC